MTSGEGFGIACPLPGAEEEVVRLADGGGGRAMERLLETIVRPVFDDALLAQRHDGATLELEGPVAFTTDSYVVQPLVFPGGDIGMLAVNGTVNDLAMCGAVPLYLSVGLILEEGLPLATLRGVLESMRRAADAARVRLVTGDTKVVERGKADGLFVNTSGVGRIVAPAPVRPSAVQPGDVCLVSGDIGRHGIAIMAARNALGFESVIESDCASVADAALALLEAGVSVRCLRDLTRGGLASALVEIAETAGAAITLEEPAIPVADDVTAACELLGLDTLHVASEGRFVAFVPEAEAARAVEILRGYDVARSAAVIGRVHDAEPGRVSSRSALGPERVVDMLSGEQLPRIC